jgi:crotonobetainyl-CoA:carnitine CoA-transferase CaiB-like acyl-CoA transferase
MDGAHFFKDEVVVELAGVLAGPLAGRFFAEHGAKVIKIENPHSGGDVTRGWYTQNEDSKGISAYYLSVNQGKEARMIDLKSEQGKQAFYALLHQATILITNFRPIDFERFNLYFDTLKLQFPKLIIGQIDGFGRDNNRPAYDMVLQAESGYLSMTGTPHGELVKMPVALIDVLAGQHLKSGLLMALLNRNKMNTGALVRVSLLDAALSSLMNQSAAYLKTGYAPGPMGTLHPSIAPYGECFETSDGKQLVLAIGSDSQFDALLQICGLHKIREQGDFRTNLDRVQRRAELYTILRPCILKNSREYWMGILLDKGIPAGAVLELDEVLESEPAKALLFGIGDNENETHSLRTSPILFE